MTKQKYILARFGAVERKIAVQELSFGLFYYNSRYYIGQGADKRVLPGAEYIQPDYTFRYQGND